MGKCRFYDKKGVFTQMTFTVECGSQRQKCQIYGGLTFRSNVVFLIVSEEKR